MKRYFQRIIHVSLILCLMIVNLYIPKVTADSKTFGEIKKELAEYKAKYENNKLEQQLTKEEREKTKSNIITIENTISKTQEEIYNTKLEIEKLNADIIIKEQEIASILSYYQVSNGESAYLEYAFGAQNFTDFIYRVAISEQLTSYNNSLVEQYKKDIEESKKKSEELTIKVNNLEKQQEQLKNELVKIGNDLEGLADDAIDIEMQIDLIENQIEVFESMGCKNDETLDDCARNKIPLDTGFVRPLQTGYITGYPGWRCITLEGKYSCSTHHGLDMSASGAASKDHPIYPIANGVVVAVYEYKGGIMKGGRKVFVQHNIKGKLYVSSYWHMRRIDVEKGQIVTRNTQLGIMGGTESWDPWTTGAHLHLELSTSDFKEGNLYSTRAGWLHAEYYIKFPAKYVTWSSRY